MASKLPEREVPAAADVVGLVGLLLVGTGALLVSVRLVWLAWQAWGWWSGLAYAGVGLALLVLAAVGAWTYTTGIPAARTRWHEWRLARERRAREAEQEGDSEGAD